MSLQAYEPMSLRAYEPMSLHCGHILSSPPSVSIFLVFHGISLSRHELWMTANWKHCCRDLTVNHQLTSWLQGLNIFQSFKIKLTFETKNRLKISPIQRRRKKLFWLFRMFFETKHPPPCQKENLKLANPPYPLVRKKSEIGWHIM